MLAKSIIVFALVSLGYAQAVPFRAIRYPSVNVMRPLPHRFPPGVHTREMHNLPHPYHEGEGHSHPHSHSRGDGVFTAGKREPQRFNPNPVFRPIRPPGWGVHPPPLQFRPAGAIKREPRDRPVRPRIPANPRKPLRSP